MVKPVSSEGWIYTNANYKDSLLFYRDCHEGQLDIPNLYEAKILSIEGITISVNQPWKAMSADITLSCYCDGLIENISLRGNTFFLNKTLAFVFDQKILE